MIRPGEEWGAPASGPPDLEIAGTDADLAAAVARHPGALVRFRPDPESDLARATGLTGTAARAAGGFAVPVDALLVRPGPAGGTDAAPSTAVNMVVVGTAPDALRRGVRRFGANVRVDGRVAFHGPCTTVVVATGQFLRGLDVVPRGHPGDGRAEVQVYAVAGRERAALRARLTTGTHVPHPAITQRTGAEIRVDCDRRVALSVDGRTLAPADLVEVTVVPGAYRLLL